MKTAIAIDALRAAVARMPHDRLTPTRRAALEHLDREGTPTIRHEDWKYTDLATVIEISNQWLADGARTVAPPSADATIASITRRFDAHWLIIANGAVDTDSITAAQMAGIHVTPLSESQSIPQFEAPLSDLNIALLRDGLHIRIDAGAAPDKAIGVLVIDSAAVAAATSQTRVEIELAANSKASFIEYHRSTGDADHYANSVFNLVVGDNADANYVRLQDRDPGHSQTGRLTASLARDSRFRHCAFDLGGKLIRNDLSIELTGPGAAASLHGLYLAGDEQHIDNHTRIDHRVGLSRSEQEYRGILSDAARCVWNGKAIVHNGADGTDAKQANHNLLLSKTAEVDAKPELEIYADDVKCSHGTTIGQLDEAAMFYLRTRGLDKREARQLMTRAFAQSIVGMTPIESYQEAIREQVADRLNQLTLGDDQ